MPVNREAGVDWVEKPSDRLARLENQVVRNTDSLTKGVFDQTEMRKDLCSLRKAVEGILHTLEQEHSEELAELRRRAEMPRRILLAVAVPVLIAVITALILTGVGHIHVA